MGDIEFEEEKKLYKTKSFMFVAKGDIPIKVLATTKEIAYDIISILNKELPVKEQYHKRFWFFSHNVLVNKKPKDIEDKEYEAIKGMANNRRAYNEKQAQK